MAYVLRNSIGFHLNRAANIVHAGFSKCLEPYGIAPEQFATLKIISEDGEINQSEIAEMLAKGKPTVSRALDALEKKGLIIREAHDADRRIKPIRPSAKGQEMLDAVQPKAQKFNEAIRSRLAPGEAETFFHVLETIVETTQHQIHPGE
jgi:DNA-binding MarR family transcriptional regulator